MSQRSQLRATTFLDVTTQDTALDLVRAASLKLATAYRTAPGEEHRDVRATTARMLHELVEPTTRGKHYGTVGGTLDFESLPPPERSAGALWRQVQIDVRLYCEDYPGAFARVKQSLGRERKRLTLETAAAILSRHFQSKISGHLLNAAASKATIEKLTTALSTLKAELPDLFHKTSARLVGHVAKDLVLLQLRSPDDFVPLIQTLAISPGALQQAKDELLATVNYSRAMSQALPGELWPLTTCPPSINSLRLTLMKLHFEVQQFEDPAPYEAALAGMQGIIRVASITDPEKASLTRSLQRLGLRVLRRYADLASHAGPPSLLCTSLALAASEKSTETHDLLRSLVHKYLEHGHFLHVSQMLARGTVTAESTINLSRVAEEVPKWLTEASHRTSTFDQVEGLRGIYTFCETIFSQLTEESQQRVLTALREHRLPPVRTSASPLEVGYRADITTILRRLSRHGAQQSWFQRLSNSCRAVLTHGLGWFKR